MFDFDKNLLFGRARIGNLALCVKAKGAEHMPACACPHADRVVRVYCIDRRLMKMPGPVSRNSSTIDRPAPRKPSSCERGEGELYKNVPLPYRARKPAKRTAALQGGRSFKLWGR
ncbi:MAG: hypothetical protein DRH17_03895 [Deltaproteobacteria bacterium]|nr:MAG: hypothetical protein DRH17_03895 [Deltaproteobacteria bacterium]